MQFTFRQQLIYGILSISGLIWASPTSAADINIIPQPQHITQVNGHFNFNKKTTILYSDQQLSSTVKNFRNQLKNEIGLNLRTELLAREVTLLKNVIYLSIDPQMQEEAYTLKIEPGKIICKASSKAGIFYGLQSLTQLISHKGNKYSALSIFIKDKPLYSWRGYMLDEARHFFGKKTVKEYLDIMSRLKINRFHWHLTDEQAWRIEIKRYPKLTEIGAIGSWSDQQAARAFYTQEDIKEIVKYAADRNIMIIPEIDMPGHATAASRSYPEISGGGEGRWQGFTFHPTREKTYEFINNVLNEVAILFPAPYIHIGADEVHYGNQSWHTDPEIQAFIKNNNLKDEVGLEHYFVRRACDIVNSKGKKMIGWDEITNAGITPDKALVMWWRHDRIDMLKQALQQGFEVILTPRIPCYLDFVQDNSHKIGRRWQKDFATIETTYKFPENLDSIITEKYAYQIIGIQASAWTERIKDKKRLDYMTFPRLAAIAEDAWLTTPNKNYQDFERRTQVFMQYLKSKGIYYFNIFNKASTPEPWGPDKADIIAEG